MEARLARRIGPEVAVFLRLPLGSSPGAPFSRRRWPLPPAVANQLTVLWELDLSAGNNQRRAVTDGAAIDVSLGVSGITEARNCRLGSGRRAV